MRIAQSLLIVAFFGVLSLPGLFRLSGIQSGLVLKGVTRPNKEVELCHDSFHDQSYQKSVEQNFLRKSGLRPYLVKTDNQINFSLFRQLSNSYGFKAVLGRNNHLIERAYLASASKLGSKSEEKLEQKVKRLKSFQEALSSKGVEFLLLISPSKPGLYPEVVPAEFRVEGEDRQSSYERFLPLLERYGVNHFDTRAFLEGKKDESEHAFFSPSGTHWNALGACLVTSELISRISTMIGKALKQIDCRPVGMRAKPLPIDQDLSDLANLWRPDVLLEPVPQVANRTIASGNEFRPNVLFVGTSFMWALLRYFDFHHTFAKRNLYYYFKRDYKYPQMSNHPIARDKISWRHIAKRDIVIFEVNEAFVNRVGYGFMKVVLGNAKRALDRVG